MHLPEDGHMNGRNMCIIYFHTLTVHLLVLVSFKLLTVPLWIIKIEGTMYFTSR